MAIVIDPSTKVITLDSFNVSASEIWSRWVDWLTLSDNSKYLPAFSQLGGVAPVALYLFLENGWRVRPQEADGQTTVTGNLLVQGGGNPFIPTIGNFASQIVLEAPLAAQAITVNTGSGVITQDIIDIAQAVWDNSTGASVESKNSEVHQRLDLDTNKPNTYTDDASSIVNDDFTLTRTNNGNGNSTVQRS